MRPAIMPKYANSSANLRKSHTRHFARSMILLRSPSAEMVNRFITRQTQLELTYAAVGATANEPPQDYRTDHTRVELGQGEQVFLAAKAALEHWEQFRIGWLEAAPATTPIARGAVVAVIAR